jgi:hypothetical protein
MDIIAKMISIDSIAYRLSYFLAMRFLFGTFWGFVG